MIKNSINDREICVTYPSFERLAERISYITNILREDLKNMGDVQSIDSINVKKDSEGKYKIVYTIKVN